MKKPTNTLRTIESTDNTSYAVGSKIQENRHGMWDINEEPDDEN